MDIKTENGKAFLEGNIQIYVYVLCIFKCGLCVCISACGYHLL